MAVKVVWLFLCVLYGSMFAQRRQWVEVEVVVSVDQEQLRESCTANVGGRADAVGLLGLFSITPSNTAERATKYSPMHHITQIDLYHFRESHLF